MKSEIVPGTEARTTSIEEGFVSGCCRFKDVGFLQGGKRGRGKALEAMV